MRRLPTLRDHRVLRPAQTVLALGLLSSMDLLRLKSIARLYARGLPPENTWEDLLQEALSRVIAGRRRPPTGVPMLSFVAGILRSLRADAWRRARLRAEQSLDDHVQVPALPDSAPGPEQVVLARQALVVIHDLFAKDAAALSIFEGLGEGLSPEEICVATGLSRTEYDSARRRIRRALLKEGLACAD